ELARGTRESRGHRFPGCDQHARRAERHHTARYRIHGKDRQGGRDQAGIAMAGKLKLSMMIGDYEIVRPLKDGKVEPKGIELLVADYPGTRDIHDKVAAGSACDINEFNGGAYVVQRHNGRDDFTALPVFLHRRFRHGFVYINRSKGIERPTDLIGRRVACRTLGAAAHHSMRGHLDEDYHVPHRAITCAIESDDDAPREAPPDLKLEARHTWVVESLVLAFEEAKQLAYQRLANPRNVPLAWFRTYWEEERARLGPDPWEYGLSELNKRNYDTLVGWVHEQVLTGA